MQNPLKKTNTFLRRKSDLLRDYVTGGIALTMFGLFLAHQYRKINPPDPVDEPQYSQESSLLDFVQDNIRKQVHLKVEQVKQLKEK